MTTEPVLERVWHDITEHIPHHQNATTKEHDMSLATFEQDIRNDVQAGMDKAADLYNHLKAVAEQRLPQLAAIQASPVAQAIEGVILPPDVEAELTAIVKTYAARFGAAPAPVAAEPAATDAAPAAPADGAAAAEPAAAS
jgi:hypothetical protein